MRIGMSLAAVLLVALPAWAQKKPEPPPHFGVVAETEFNPQDSPKQTLASIAKALERKRMDYLLAHLVDPAFTDPVFARYYRQRYGKNPAEESDVKKEEIAERTRTALADFVAEVNDHMASEPKQTIRFQRLLKEGDVEEVGQ